MKELQKLVAYDRGTQCTGINVFEKKRANVRVWEYSGKYMSE